MMDVLHCLLVFLEGFWDGLQRCLACLETEGVSGNVLPLLPEDGRVVFYRIVIYIIINLRTFGFVLGFGL